MCVTARHKEIKLPNGLPSCGCKYLTVTEVDQMPIFLINLELAYYRAPGKHEVHYNTARISFTKSRRSTIARSGICCSEP